MSRDDAYKMTREDVMRELELLPVWTLRTPQLRQIVVAAIPPVLVLATNEAIIETPQQIEHAAVFIASDDKKWLFVLPAELTGQAADLFNNILRALPINKTQISHTLKLTQEIVGLQASIVIAMGETIAQPLLSSAESIESLRGKIHTVNGLPIIVTYHPVELLQRLPNKAKTWDDLCMALSVLDA